mmetsp:Transcript_34980/g.88120  ORF Transcript_34980/g.88120 Transcript_34980/m.88120 type:complete len:255 (-) Transcript_34980:2564-3328(-)
MSSCNESITLMSSSTEMKAMPGRKMTLMLAATCPSVVFSMRPLTMRATLGSLFSASATFMMGVLMFLAPLIISLMRGTPRVTFMLATPAKWNVLSVICVPGSPMDCAPNAPTVEPGSTRLRWYLVTHSRRKTSSCASVMLACPASSSVTTSPTASTARPQRSRASRYAPTILPRCPSTIPKKERLQNSGSARRHAPSLAATASVSAPGSGTDGVVPSAGHGRYIIARTRNSRRFRSSAALFLPSMHTGSMPSSP